ncbi:hypothetical protein CPB86DRAFT_784198 [Serendipita vermifera]|nr:hypothetical protein CPB86DRAFT_784198 [Serendipita vermifera]
MDTQFLSMPYDSLSMHEAGSVTPDVTDSDYALRLDPSFNDILGLSGIDYNNYIEESLCSPGALSSDPALFWLSEEGAAHYLSQDDGSTTDEFSVAPSTPPDLSFSSSPSPSSLKSPTPAPATPTTPGPAEWTYDEFQQGIAHDSCLVSAFDRALVLIGQCESPPKELVREFVQPGKPGFVCAVKGCDWNRRGWKREDRGIAHVLREHFRILKYPCAECGLVYKWSHDLEKHRKLRHRAEGERAPPRFPCSHPNCTQTFDRTFNLNRHLKTHRKRPNRTQHGGGPIRGGH